MGYNAYGQDIAKGIYSFTRTDNLSESVKLINSLTGKTITDSMSVALGKTKKIIISPQNASAANFDIEVSDNISFTEPGIIKGLTKGEGSITISQNGKVLKAIKINVV